MIRKNKNTVPWTYIIRDLKGVKIIETCYKKELKKTDEKELRIKKVIKRKADKL